jgi:hypothetical protein
MWCSTLTTITSHNRPTSSEFEDEWRINNFLGRPIKRPERLFLQLFIRNPRTRSSQESGFSIDL